MVESNAEKVVAQMTAMIRLAVAVDWRRNMREEYQRESGEWVRNTRARGAEKQHKIKNQSIKTHPS
jgi:hypothetical protein